MRASTLMFAAGLWLAASPLHAGGISSQAGADADMQQLLQQMADLPEAERLLMEQALRASQPQSQPEPAMGLHTAQQEEMLRVLQQMPGLPERERQLMEQAILTMDTPIDQRTPTCAAQPVGGEQPACKSA